jgi:hypothetical protein
MKTLVILLVLLSNFVCGQNLPVVVDNIEFFPPAVGQNSIPDCSHLALIYNLKSAIWNRKFQRDPKLKENQFSHTFVWNQNLNPITESSNPEDALQFMKYQGCATVAEFPLDEQSTENRPSLDVREKALAYKSKWLSQAYFYNDRTDESVTAQLNVLKDSLFQGKCFILSLFLYNDFFKMSGENQVFSYYDYKSLDIYPAAKHVVTIVGYNDTIKTASGRGAFKVLDAKTDRISSGIYYLDYDWFYRSSDNFWHFFLEEDFSFTMPKTVMHLNISGSIEPIDMVYGRNMIITSLFDFNDKKIAFQDYYQYLYNRQQIQIDAVNNKPVILEDSPVLYPRNNTTGSYQLVTDLSAIDDLKSLSVIIYDPLSIEFIGADPWFTSGRREANLKINDALIHVLATDKNIQAKIIDLPDTTIVLNDFYLENLFCNWNDTVYNPGFIKSYAAVLKRKLVTFDIATAVSQINVPKVEFNVFPNPVSDMATIEFSLPQSGMVNIVIFNSLGQLMGNIANVVAEPGTQTINYDTSNLKTGMYIFRLTSDSFSQSIKIVKQ